MSLEERNCRWHIYVLDCVNSHIYVAISLATAALAAVLFAIGVPLLYYRVRIRGFKIWQGGFTTIDGYLYWVNFFALFRMVQCLGLALGWFKHAVVAQLLSELGYLSGLMGVVVYLCSLVAATPATAPDVWLPQAATLRMTRVAFMVVCWIMIPMGIGSGVSHDRKNYDHEWALTAALYILYAVTCLCMAVGFWLFGRQMVRVAEASLQDEFMADYRDSHKGPKHGKHNDERTASGRRSNQVASHASNKSTHRQMRQAVVKMKIFNFQFTSIFVWFGLVLFVFAIAQNVIFATQWWSIIQCIGSDIGTVALILGGHVCIAYAEVRRYLDEKEAPPTTPAAGGAGVKMSSTSGARGAGQPSTAVPPMPSVQTVRESSRMDI